MASKKNKTPGSEKLPNAKWELFAHLYSGHHNMALFGNATQCYATAYQYTERIQTLQEAIEDLLSKAEAGYTVKVKAHEAAVRRIKNTCAVEGARLLTYPKVRERCDYLMDQTISHDFVDRELQFVILQRGDLNAKVQAIREYDRVRNRVSDNKLEGNFTFSWEPTPR